MKKLLPIMFLLSGCVEGMTNDQLIMETHKCEKAGMRAIMLCSGLDPSVCIIKCKPHPDGCQHADSDSTT